MFYTLEDENRYLVVTEKEAREYIENWITTADGEDCFDVWLNETYTAADIYRQSEDNFFMDGLTDEFIDYVLTEDVCENITAIEISKEAEREILERYSYNLNLVSKE